MFDDILIKEDHFITCAGGCGKRVKVNSESQAEMIKWTCTECVDKEVEDYV